MNTNCDVVTVFTAPYERFLHDSVRSIQDQGRKDWLLHLVCDGDPKLATRIANQYARDPRIRVYCNEQNLGPYTSIMRIADRLRSGVLLIQDADDVALPHRLEASLAALADPSVAAYNGAMLQFVDESSRNDSDMTRKVADRPILLPEEPLKGLPHGRLVHGAMAVRTDVFRSLNGYEDWFCGADTEFCQRLQKSYRVVHSTDVIAKRRLHSDSLTNSKQRGHGSAERKRNADELLNRVGGFSNASAKKFGKLDRIAELSHLTRILPPGKPTEAQPIGPRSPIRVGYIYPHWTLGGTGRSVYTLMLHRPEGVEFSGMAIKSLRLFNAEGQRRCGVPIWYGGKEPGNLSDYPGVTFASSFQEACQAIIDRSDVVMLWGFGSSEPTFDRLKWRGRKVVVTTHGCCDYTHKLVNTVGRYATHYRAVSKAAAEIWGAERRDQVRVVYNGVDLNRTVPLRPRQEIRRNWGIGDSEIVIAYIGRLAPDKNPTALARTVAELGPPYRALYVGSGHAEDRVRKEVEAVLGSTAIFTGAIEQVGDALAALDCFLLASPSEGHCQALNEAWAAGVPVVATRVGAVPELEDEYGPLVVPIPVNATSEQMARAVKTALAPENKEVISRAQLMVHSRFTVSHMVREFSRHMHDIVKGTENRKHASQPDGLSQRSSDEQLDCSIVITASRPNLFPDALRHVRDVFPEYREIVIAAAPDLPQKTLDLIGATPRCRTIPGTSDRSEAGEALFRAMDECVGEWIVHVDDDDIWVECDKRQVRNVDRDVAVVSGGAVYCDFSPDNPRSPRRLFGRNTSDIRDLDVPLNDSTAVLPGSFRLIRRSAWQKVRASVPRQFAYNEYSVLLCLLHAGYRMEASQSVWGVVRRFHSTRRAPEVPKWQTVYHSLLARLDHQQPRKTVSVSRTSLARVFSGSRQRISQWAVGVTTAPRTRPTLKHTLQSLKEAGWKAPRLFAEPGTEIPPEFGDLRCTQRAEKLGAFPNWYLGLSELYLRDPQAEAYLICQDDVWLSRGAKAYLESVLWPAPEVGVVSIYCPSHEHQEGAARFHEVDRGWGAWGALAYLFSNPGVREILSDLEVINHRHHGPAGGLRNIDSVVGAWCQRQKLPYFVHVPSLAQHIGATSTIWAGGRATGRRRAAVTARNLTSGRKMER